MREFESGLRFEERGLSAGSPVKYFVRTFEAPRLVRMHYHNSLEINVCRNIKGLIRFETGESDLSNDCMLLIPAGTPHAYTLFESGGTIEVYHLLTAELPGVDAALSGLADSVLFTGICSESERLLRMIRLEESSVLRLSGELLLLADLFAFGKAGAGKIANPSDSFLKRVIGYAENNYHRSLSLDEISIHVGVSRFHFSRLFRQRTGENWSSYLNSLRLSESLKLLRKGLTVADSAAECGFESSSYFISCFKRQYSMTPLQWLKQNKAQ